MGCFQHCLMGHNSRNMKDSVADCDLMHCRDQGVSEEKVDMWHRDWSCSILMKNVAVLGPCPKNLPEAKVKSFGLIPLEEEISKQPGIDSVIWLLVITLMEIYNEKKKAVQGKIFRRKRTSESRMESCVPGDKQIKNLSKWSSDLRARSHPVKFPVCEKELKKNWSRVWQGIPLISALGKQRQADL